MINWGISGVKLIPNDHQDPMAAFAKTYTYCLYINYLLFPTEVKSRLFDTTLGIRDPSKEAVPVQPLQPVSAD